MRRLSRKEMESLRGRQTGVGTGIGGGGTGGTPSTYRNKYFCGVYPWQRSLRDVNLCNGNLFKSFTDNIQVAPARGAGLALQRTYNSCDDRNGPFGVGWTHAYDIRMEAAAADIGTTDNEIGMDGTVKHFFLNGSGGAAGTERACDTITDRYGNQTALTYGQTITMADGSTKKVLTAVTDPSGRSLTFTWTNLGTPQPAYRITGVTGPLYSVTYSYNAEFNLASVTLDRTQASLLFQAICHRYDRNQPIILTSNKAFSDWGEAFAQAAVMASAALDRLPHRCTVVHIRGESYRLRERRHAGLNTTIPTAAPTSVPAGNGASGSILNGA